MAPEEIETETAKIQEGWSKTERANRAGEELVPWTAPVFVFDAAGVAEVAENVI